MAAVGPDSASRGVVDSLETWLNVRDQSDYTMFADIFTSPRKLRTVLMHFRSHSATKPPFGALPSDVSPDAPSIDVRPEQEQADSIWHSLLWKWLLMPRGLTILRNDTVVFGMNKAFDFSAAGLHRSEAGGRVLRAIAAAPPGGDAPLQVHIVKKRNGEMARVFFDADGAGGGRWLFAQKNRSVLVAGRAELAALVAEASDASAAAEAVRHALEVGEAWFTLLDGLGPAAEAELRAFCATHVLALEKVGSRFQQHLARETAPDAAPALAVFAINPTDAAWQREAICAGVLPRLGVAAMITACGRLGLPWAGYLPASLLLDADADAVAEAGGGGGAGGGGVLPAGIRAQLEEAAAAGSPTVVAVRSVAELEALRRCILSADADDVEGAVPVCEDGAGRALALFKFKVAIYYFRRRLREQIRHGVTSPQLPGLRARLEEWVIKAPRRRRRGLRRLAERVFHYSQATGVVGEAVDRGILRILETCSVPATAQAAGGGDPEDACYAGCPLCDPDAQVPRTLIATLPGAVAAVAAAVAAAHPLVQVERWPDATSGSQRMTPVALAGWASGTAVLIADATKLPPPPSAAVLDPALRVQRIVLVRPPPGPADPAAIALAFPDNPRAAAAVYARAAALLAELDEAAAAAAGRPDAPAVSVAYDAAGAAAAIRPGPRDPLPAQAGEGGGGGPTAATAPAAAPSRTRLVVFVVGVVGLGKTTLALALRDWLAARPVSPSAAATPAPPLAAAVDQDEFSSLGREGSKAAVLARLHSLLDEGVDIVLVHRNGPGSAPLLAALAARGVPWAVLSPAELCAEAGVGAAVAPLPAAVLAVARSLKSRAAEAEAGVAPGASLSPLAPPAHPLMGLPLAKQVHVLRSFLSALPEVVASVSEGAAAVLPLAYFEEAPPPAAVTTAASVGPLLAAQRFLVAVGGLSGGWAKEEEPDAVDAALAAAACADASAGVALRRRPLAVLAEEAGERILRAAAAAAAGGAARSLEDEEAAAEARSVLFAAVFVKPPASVMEPPPGATPPAEPHMTLVHRSSSPAALAALLSRGLLGSRATLTATHRVTARWEGTAPGQPAQAVCCLVVGAAALQQVQGGGPTDLLPLVAAGHPHVTLWTDGGAPRALSRHVLALLAAASPSALSAAAAAAPAPLEVRAADIRFTVEALQPPVALVGAISTRE